MTEKITIRIPDALVARIEAAARAGFETCESFIPIALARIFPKRHKRKLHRNGGKAPSDRLLRPVKPGTKRARLLRWFIRSLVPTVDGAARVFRCSREGIFAHLTAMRSVHGIGYSFDAERDSITIKLPCEACGLMRSVAVDAGR